MTLDCARVNFIFCCCIRLAHTLTAETPHHHPIRIQDLTVAIAIVSIEIQQRTHTHTRAILILKESKGQQKWLCVSVWAGLMYRTEMAYGYNVGYWFKQNRVQAGRLLSRWNCVLAPLRLVEGECKRKEAIDDSEKKGERLNECVRYRDTGNVDEGALVLNVALMFLKRPPNGQFPSVLWAQTVTQKVPLRARVVHTGSHSHVAHTHRESRRLYLWLLICQILLHLHSISHTFNRFTHNFYSYGSAHKMARSLENNPAIFHISLWCLAKCSYLLKGFGVVFVCVFQISLPICAWVPFCVCVNVLIITDVQWLWNSVIAHESFIAARRDVSINSFQNF